jgi:hypothetical protein
MKEFNATIDINWAHTNIEARNERQAIQLVKDYFFKNYNGMILEDYEISVYEREDI